MFKFFGYLDRRRFLYASLIRIGLYIASVFAFPIFLRMLRETTRCGVDTCGVVGLIGAMAVKPLVFVLLVFSFVGISMRRARDAGVPAWLGLFIPTLFAADFTFLVFTGAPWAFGFSSGVLGIPFPRNTLLALGCIALLGALPSRDDDRRNPFGAAGWIAFALALYIAVSAVLGIASYVATMVMMGSPAAMPVIRDISKVLWSTGRGVPYAMVGLVAVLAWIAWRERGHVMAGPRQVPATPAGRYLPFAIAAALAGALTLVALNLSTPRGVGLPMLMVTQTATLVLPTFLIYFALLAALYLVATRRTVTSTLLLAVALLPFAHFAYAHWRAAQEHQREAAEIASIPTMRAARLPATLVIDSPHTQAIRAAWTIPGIERVILYGTHGSRLMQIDRPAQRGPSQRPVPIAALPDEYLLLRVGPSSGFAKKRQPYASAGGPLELRLIDPARNDLIAVWYRTFRPSPPFAPVLTVMGWFRGSNSATTDEIQNTVAGFLSRALRAAG